MAITVHIGVDYEDAGCVKIMASDAFDPVTTPDSEYAKFLFNSKDVDQFRYAGANVGAYTDINGTSYTPSGSNASNYTKVNQGRNLGYDWVAWTPGYFPALDYDLPLHDMKRVLGGWVQGPIVSAKTYGYQDRCGEYSLWQSQEGGWMRNWSASFPELGNSKASMVGTKPASGTWPLDQGNRQLVVWNLPGDDTAIKDPPLTPVAGQVAAQITREFCRAAKPGYDVQTATRSQLALDSSSRPVKVIFAADMAVPAGTTDLDMTPYLNGIAVTGDLVVDISAYQGSVIYYPTSPLSSDVSFGVRYQIVGGTTVRLNNPYSSCRARVVVIAEDASAPTAGDNDVIREFNDGTRDVFQLLRPGAANPPTLADVIIDSRWPALRIIREGTIALTNGNGVEYSVPFDSSGLFPIVKYMTVHGAGGNAQFTGSFAKRVRSPFTKRIYASGTGAPGTITAGDTTYCRLTATEARFYSFRGNFISYDCNSRTTSPGYEFSANSDPNPPTHIRYYILGIPAS